MLFFIWYCVLSKDELYCFEIYKECSKHQVLKSDIIEHLIRLRSRSSFGSFLILIEWSEILGRRNLDVIVSFLNRHYYKFERRRHRIDKRRWPWLNVMTGKKKNIYNVLMYRFGTQHLSKRKAQRRLTCLYPWRMDSYLSTNLKSEDESMEFEDQRLESMDIIDITSIQMFLQTRRRVRRRRSKEGIVLRDIRFQCKLRIKIVYIWAASKLFCGYLYSTKFIQITPHEFDMRLAFQEKSNETFVIDITNIRDMTQIMWINSSDEDMQNFNPNKIKYVTWSTMRKLWLREKIKAQRTTT